MICSEDEFDIKMKLEREDDEEDSGVNVESLKKRKLIMKKFEVSEGSEYEDCNEESNEKEEDNNEKEQEPENPIVQGKTWYTVISVY
jgi:hypothetical protein